MYCRFNASCYKDDLNCIQENLFSLLVLYMISVSEFGEFSAGTFDSIIELNTLSKDKLGHNHSAPNFRGR